MLDTTSAIVVVSALAATWAMAGVIWVIQLVHYPIFDAVERGESDDSWRRFADRHRRSISFVVGPFMAVEGVTGIWLVVDPPGHVGLFLPLVAAALMAVAYGTTAFVSAPLHGRIADAFDERMHRLLVTTNWIRTVAWTARGLVVAVIAIAAV